ncbi:MAG: hypothetical protein KDD76_01790, partial [Rickettsiales bacterium]|nr:hypothetical protein [Rickettsiales bacterium]
AHALETRYPEIWPKIWQQVFSAGDDYELLFTAPEDKLAEIKNFSQTLALPITRIGIATKSKHAPRLLDVSGSSISITKQGFMHL